jgi:hypothetical protein
MVATQLEGGVPAFLHYPSFDQIFQPGVAQQKGSDASRNFVLTLAPRNIQKANNPTDGQEKLIDRAQAGIGGGVGRYLIDQNGRLVYYAIHVNPAFLQFLKNQNLTTVDGIKHIDSSLTFLGSDSDIAAGINTNVVEYKSAWMVVDKQHPPSNYFVVPAKIPHYVVNGDSLVQAIQNGNPVFDDVNVALIAFHVVFTLPGHPEMIWSTFEHVSIDGNGKAVRDNAPEAADNPSKTSPDAVISTQSFPLYKAGTAAKGANIPLDLKSIVQFWDTNKQAFLKKDGTKVQTSVYRPYPGSKTDGSAQNPDHSEDDEISRINDHATTMFLDAKAKSPMGAADRRENYRLVGAIWLDRPASGANPSFTTPGQAFSIGSNQSADDVGQPLAGEGRLGSTAMESFTEFENGAPNCFSCHDTQAIKDKRKLIGAARLNVNHVLSKFMDLQPVPKQ